MTHLYEYLDGRDETMLRYIDNCTPAQPYAPGASFVSIPVESNVVLRAMYDMVTDMILATRKEFIESVKGARSSDALVCSYGFRALDRMRRQLVEIAGEREGADWVKMAGW